MGMSKVQAGSIEWWEYARRTLINKDASRSEVDCALIGIKGSKDTWLKQELKRRESKLGRARSAC